MRGILAKKIGMTQLFSSKGEVIPVTILQVKENIVIQKKNEENDGYNAVQLGFEDKPLRLCNRSEKFIAKKSKTTPKRFLKEIRDFELDVQVGQAITPSDLFAPGDILDITGTTKGKGFQGAIKRHNQSRGPMSHGSRYHRRPGSMGAITANRVFKGKKLPGHMGCKKVTAQNLELIKIDKQNNVILIKGNVPGNKKSIVLVKNNIKNKASREKRDLVNFMKENTTAKEDK